MKTTDPLTRSVPVPDPRRKLSDKAGGTTVENPWPLRLLSKNMRAYIDRMPELWVEGQIIEYKPRPGTKLAFFVIRDIEADVSIPVNAFVGVVEAAGPLFEAGTRVVMKVKPSFWEARGSLSLRAAEIYIQGEGDLLAQIEKLRRKLAGEGLFSSEHKRPLPFLPRCVGLICGRNAKAKEDVVVNATLRWPALQFEIREVAVQGANCVTEVSNAIAELGSLPDVDVIVITRGGGSVEDLLPFSDEHMVRTAYSCPTPIVSAIGHEEDAPLLDLVADYRASTPTDAARRIVPDHRELAQELDHLTQRLRSAIERRLHREAENLALLASRPVLAQPGAAIDQQLTRLDTAVLRMHNAVNRQVAREEANLAQLDATLRALSPQGTLERGYSILRDPSGHVVTDASQLKRGDLLEGILAQGTFVSQVVGMNPAKTEDDPDHETE